MNTLWVNLAGIIAIALIIWWFWLYKPKVRRLTSADPIEIVVEDGVYTPSRIQVSAGKPITLKILRKDPSPCAQRILFNDLGISRDLSLGKTEEVTFTPEKPGDYEFTCQVGMYRGLLVVRDRE